MNREGLLRPSEGARQLEELLSTGDLPLTRMVAEAKFARSRIPWSEELERAIVAGVMLEAVLEVRLPGDDPQAQRSLIRSRLLHSLIETLSGNVTLAYFRSLLCRVDQWFCFYYPLMPAPPAPGQFQGAPAPDICPSPVSHYLLREWLEKVGREILPRRRQRKMSPERLADFLESRGGSWFCVKDLARDFGLNDKTAWQYLVKLQEAGLLLHNGRRSAAVRWRLADAFLLRGE